MMVSDLGAGEYIKARAAISSPALYTRGRRRGFERYLGIQREYDTVAELFHEKKDCYR